MKKLKGTIDIGTLKILKKIYKKNKKSIAKKIKIDIIINVVNIPK